jgi:hypothetical protein
MSELLVLAAAGRISLTQPISRAYRLDQADEAYRALDPGEITAARSWWCRLAGRRRA